MQRVMQLLAIAIFLLLGASFTQMHDWATGYHHSARWDPWAYLAGACFVLAYLTAWAGRQIGYPRSRAAKHDQADHD